MVSNCNKDENGSLTPVLQHWESICLAPLQHIPTDARWRHFLTDELRNAARQMGDAVLKEDTRSCYWNLPVSSLHTIITDRSGQNFENK